MAMYIDFKKPGDVKVNTICWHTMEPKPGPMGLAALSPKRRRAISRQGVAARRAAVGCANSSDS